MIKKLLTGFALLVIALPALLSADPNLDPLVGEWSVSTTEEAGDCAEMRMVFDFENNYDVRVIEDGRRKVLVYGNWSRDGKVVTVRDSDGRSERLTVEAESYERIVLVSRDSHVDRALGVGYLDLRRCAAY